MNILALDTSSMVATAALINGEKLIGETIINHKRTHSQKLMPMIDDLLKSCEMDLKDVDVIAVAEGPGSFTGLRIGVATAKGLAHAMDIPVVGISTLDALAFNLPFCHGLVCPILDARRSQVYTALYKWDDGVLHTLEIPTALSLDELLEKLDQRLEPVIFLGDGVKPNKEILMDRLKERAYFAPKAMNMPRASSVGELALQRAEKGELDNFYRLTPTYLRKSEAERQYEQKMKRCGMDEPCED